MFATTIVYKKNLEATKKYVVNQGGTSSGKTYAICQLLFYLSTLEDNTIITVVGQDIPNLKKGAYRDAINIYNNTKPLHDQFESINKTERIFQHKNGSIIEFTSYSDEQDAKNGKRDYLFVNEANGITYEIFWQLAIRTRKQVFIDYNPTSRFWVHEKLIGKPDVQLIISDHRHNLFLSKETHDEIEGIEDKELFKVYARGKTGKLQGLIYNNWQLVDNMPTDYKKRFIGLDFGFTNDPTAIIDVMLSEGQLWLNEVCYKKEMLNSDIYDILKEENHLKTLVIADSAEPKSIAELKSKGVKIEPALKGADSVKNGIDILKRYRLNVTRKSVNLKRELLSYKWKEDRKTGEATNEPIDAFNHALDAVRYVALNKIGDIKKGNKVLAFGFTN